VSQFVRLEQCERYLRFRLAERAGQKFMEEYNVIPQRIPPLLSLSGSTFEGEIEADPLSAPFCLSWTVAPKPSRLWSALSRAFAHFTASRVWAATRDTASRRRR
jgi:hypothetical protein